MRLLLCTTALLSVLAATAQGASLPTVKSGHRPGPDILYAKPTTAPQLRNAGPWKAAPILVSGTQAYRKGEFLYQDFLYDDHGAQGTEDPNDPHDPVQHLFSPRKGTLSYPTAPEFADNAADLVELRIRRLRGATALRVTLNTLADPEQTAFTVAIGGASTETVAWPHDAGVRSPAELFLTVHGTTAELVRADGGQALKPAPIASISRKRRQWDVRVPHAAFDPERRTLRLSAGVGLWDVAGRRYLTPTGTASESQPGGGADGGSGLFNMAFRYDEPLPKISEPPVANTIAEGGAGVKEDGAWWRERAQALTLAAGDVSAFSAFVDFGKLARRVTDNRRVPKTGFTDRILSSRQVYGEGIDHDRSCTTSVAGGSTCIPRVLGRLQPYALYVPKRARPKRGWGLTLLLHGLSANHNEFIASRHMKDFGDRGPGSVVASPLGRGPDGGWVGVAEGDAFEVWADAARRFKLDSRHNAVSGYSMGGVGTFRLTTRFPDLFARGAPVVGSSAGLEAELASLRHVPVMLWNVAQDELVNAGLTAATRLGLESAGVRFDSWLFDVGGHITLGNNDEYGPMAEFLGSHRAVRNPAHVTYVVNPPQDSARALSIADHAYWTSRLRVRDEAEPGIIDARSEGIGRGDAPVGDLEHGRGTLEGGSHGPLGYSNEKREWGPAPVTQRVDRLTVEATNLSAATINVRRAGLTCGVKLLVQTDGPFELRLAGCGAAGVTTFE